MTKSIDETIKELDKLIEWLWANSKSHNIIALSQALDKISILSMTVSTEVSAAYGLQLELQQIYESAYRKEFIAQTESKKSAASAKPSAELAVEHLEKDAIAAKVAYKKLDNYLDRLDKILDLYKQYISNLKIDRKHG